MSTINPASAAATAATSTEPALVRSIRTLRNALKESHPYERPAVTLRPHAVAWEKYTAQVGRATRFYVPAAMLFFGWPFAMRFAIDAWNGVYDAPRGKKTGERRRRE